MGGAKKGRILILGAGIMQGPAIRSAKDMGLETVVIDGDPQAPLAAAADRFECIDLKDIHGIEALARTLMAEGGLDGVMTAGTDFSASVAWTAEKTGLPGISYESALDASDKERMRRRFAQAGLPSPAFTVLREIPPAGDLSVGYPAVVKPVDNMGGRGCRRVDTFAELRDAVEGALRFSRSRRAIVEEYMEGPEFSVDAVIYRGDIRICGLADRHIRFPPYFIEMGHTMPTGIPRKDQDAIVALFIRGVRALGIDTGAAKGDIKLTKKGPMIGEIAARLSGGYMSGWTYPYASGAAPCRGALCAALGIPPEGLEPRRNWTSAERAFISIPGLVRSIEGIDGARKIPGIKDVFFRAEPGRRISFPENNVSKGGNVISAAPDRETAVTAAEEAARSIRIRLAAPDPQTEAFLRGPLKAPCFPPPAFALSEKLLQELMELPETAPRRPAFPAPQSPAPETSRGFRPFRGFLHSNLQDYMGRNPRETLDAVRELTGVAPETLPLGRGFWIALVRGGYQGGAYYIDTVIKDPAAAGAGGELP
ncbi:MAG: ATP-grasp domain-containing protein [Spirochaetaceae bacterium]|jgi:biotin carboxylase|nr:ATP-grasp domain-containing protein [Spirochaetaceae bacterium]